MIKRITALLVCMLLLFQLCVFAEEVAEEPIAEMVEKIFDAETFFSEPYVLRYTDIEDKRLNSFASFMGSMDILPGESNEIFNPDANVTRIDVVKAFLRMMNIDSSAYVGIIDGVFYDIDNTYPFYTDLSAAVKIGLISGYEDNTIRPENPISHTELYAIAAKVLGYGDYAMSSGGYPAGYIKAMTDAGLIAKIKFSGTEFVTRGDLVQFLYYVGETPMYTSVLNSITGGRPIFEKYLNMYHATGVVNATSDTALGDYVSKDNFVTINDKEYTVDSKDFNVFLGYNVDFWYIDDNFELPKIVYMSVAPKNESLFINKGEYISYSNSTITYLNNTKNKTANISSSCDYVVNGKVAAVKSFKELLSTDANNAFLTLIDNNVDGIYDVVYIEKYFNIWLKTAGTDSNGIKLNYYFDLEGTQYDPNKTTILFYNSDGTKIDCEKEVAGKISYDMSLIPSSSIVSVFTDKWKTQRGYTIPDSDATYVKIIFSEKKVTGAFTASSNEDYKIGETFYTVSQSNFFEESSSKISFGTEGDFFLDVFNELVLYQKSSESSADFAFGYLINARPQGRLAQSIHAKIMAFDGKIDIYTLSNKFKLNGDGTLSTNEIMTELKKSAKYIRPDFTISQPIQYKLNSNGEIREIQTVLQSTGLPEGVDESHINRYTESFIGYLPDDSFGIFRDTEITNNDRAPIRGYYFSPEKYMTVPNIETFEDEHYYVDRYKKDGSHFSDTEVEPYNVSMYLRPKLVIEYTEAREFEDKIYTNYSDSWPVMVKEVYQELDENGMEKSVLLCCTGAVEREYVGKSGETFNGLIPGDVVYLYTNNHATDIITKYERVTYNGVELRPTNKLPSIDVWTERAGNAYTAYGEIYAIEGNNIVVQGGPIINEETGERAIKTTCYIEGTRWQSGGTIVYDCSDPDRAEPVILNGSVSNLKSVYKDGRENASRIFYVSHQGAARAMLIYNGMESE